MVISSVHGSICRNPHPALSHGSTSNMALAPSLFASSSRKIGSSNPIWFEDATGWSILSIMGKKVDAKVQGIQQIKIKRIWINDREEQKALACQLNSMINGYGMIPIIPMVIATDVVVEISFSVMGFVDVGEIDLMVVSLAVVIFSRLSGSRNKPTYVPAGRSFPAGSRNRPTSVPAGRSFPAGSRNRPTYVPDGSVGPLSAEPGSYNQMAMDEGRWGTAVKTSAETKFCLLTQSALSSPREFKLPDSSQVVLRVPRRHNLYCFNLAQSSRKGIIKFFSVLLAKHP
ncbi:hypothetical protein Tco_0970778 [Tanacetum coccineum]